MCNIIYLDLHVPFHLVVKVGLGPYISLYVHAISFTDLHFVFFLLFVKVSLRSSSSLILLELRVRSLSCIGIFVLALASRNINIYQVEEIIII